MDKHSLLGTKKSTQLSLNSFIRPILSKAKKSELESNSAVGLFEHRRMQSNNKKSPLKKANKSLLLADNNDNIDISSADYVHGPNHDDRSERKSVWKSCWDDRNDQLRKQLKATNTKIYSNLSGSGLHFKKQKRSLIDMSDPMIGDKQRLESCSKRVRTNGECQYIAPIAMHSTELKTDESIDEMPPQSMTAQRKSTQLEKKKAIFKGVNVYFNGRTKDLSSFHLNKILVINGGMFSVMPNQNVTHIVCNNLSRSKTKKALNRLGNVGAAKYVSSQWISDCVTEGKRLDEGPYLVIRDTTNHTISSFFKTS